MSSLPDQRKKKRKDQLLRRFPLRILTIKIPIAGKFSDIAVQQMDARLLED